MAAKFSPPPFLKNFNIQKISTLRAGLIVVLGIWLIFLFDRGFFHQIDLKTYDLRLRLRKHSLDQKPSDVVVADINEDSLKKYGRWPWPRAVMAQLLVQLKNYEVRGVGFDIIFSEEIKGEKTTSLIQTKEAVFSKLPNSQNWPDGPQKRSVDQARRELEHYFNQQQKNDSDTFFSKALGLDLPITLGLIFNYESITSQEINEKSTLIQSSQICPNKFNAYKHAQGFSSVITNLPLFSKKNLGYGSFNFFPDHDGISRRTPLVIQFNQKLYPSLSLATANQTLSQKLICEKGSLGFGLGGIGLGKTSIPTDIHGSMTINYYNNSKKFPYYGIADIINQKIDKEKLQNKIVLIGTSAPALYDLRITPLRKATPGVEIHATVLQNILDEFFIYKNLNTFFVDLLLLILLGIINSYALSKLNASRGILFSLGILTFYLISTWILFSKWGIWLSWLYPILIILTTYLVITLLNYLRAESQARLEKKKRAKIKTAFQHYVSSSLVEEIIRQPDRLKLGGERRNLTIFFSDIRGFTTISEKLTPEALTDLLNEYLTPMTNIILSRDGMLDKYMGDAIMAVFGAPIPMPHHAQSACYAALQMSSELKQLQQAWEDRGIPPLKIGIGINTGEMSVGNMGSKQRFDYTVIGDHVNLGARLEGVNKIYGTEIITSEYTKNEASDVFLFRELDLLQVKGKTQAIRIFELRDTRNDSSDFQTQLIEKFEHALEVYRVQHWKKALNAFEDVLAFHPTDGPTQTFIERIKYFIKNPPPKSWNGVFQMETK